jgi:hypothetical protein
MKSPLFMKAQFRKVVVRSRPCALLIAASALVLSGCGNGVPGAQSAPVSPSASSSQPGPAGSPTAVAAAAGTRCGKVPAARGRQAEVIIRGGTVECAQATQLITQYFKTLSPGALASPDGPGPIPLGAWTCGSGPGGDPVTTCSTEDDGQVDGVLAG